MLARASLDGVAAGLPGGLPDHEWTSSERIEAELAAGASSGRHDPRVVVACLGSLTLGYALFGQFIRRGTRPRGTVPKRSSEVSIVDGAARDHRACLLEDLMTARDAAAGRRRVSATAVVPAVKAWARSLAVSRRTSPARCGRGSAGGGGQRPRRHGGLGARRGEPRARALRELRGADLRRADLQHPPHGDHDHECRGAGGGLGAPELQRGGAGAGPDHPHPARRRTDGGRRDLPPRSLHALRLALGHARLPYGRRRQHRAQSGRRLHGRGGKRRRRAHASHRHPPPSRAHPGGVGARRQRDAGPARRAHQDAHRGLRFRHRSRPAEPARPGVASCGHGRGRRRDPHRHPAARPCRRCTCCSRPTC